MKFTNKKVLVVGTGKSGVAAVRLLNKSGAEVIVLEGNTSFSTEEIISRFPKDAEFDLIIGELPEQKMNNIDFVILSPGVPTDLPFVVKLQEKNIPVWGEIELAYLCGAGKLFAITGTNGKTTSTYMMKHILEHAGNKVGLIGTIANYIGDKMIPTNMTTPEAIELFRLIKDMREGGCKYCLMEVSSHASAMGRVEGLNFSRGMFTNLTQDHMDYHKTFENYYNAKFKFIKGSKSTVINCDDKYGKKMLNTLHETTNDNKIVTSYGVEDGYVRAKNLDLQANGSSFDLYIGEDFKGKVKLHIPGLYNIYNALGVIGVLVVGGYVIVEDVIEGFDTMKAVAGRCERVYHDKMNCTVVVDYAHTPDGLENILETMKEVVKGKLITVFGCGGDRDKTKRPQMGSIAERYSDVTIVTSDNPRTEDPQKIINDILVGVSGNYEVINDRHLAIVKGMSLLKENDILMILGKGHEDYQIIGTEKIHFSDQEEVEKYIKEHQDD